MHDNYVLPKCRALVIKSVTVSAQMSVFYRVTLSIDYSYNNYRDVYN